uniref:Uncharacterized protein n=1 Tax=Spongospora subterranea TaxID=70186 RepID=A0A0H5QNL9_9EUKA|eukprot:CRZ03750.1 hypothetical protein [Spongospora subterranea]
MEDVEARRKFSLRQRQRSLAADEIAMTLEGDPDGELPFNIELQSFPQTNEVFPQAVLGGKALPSRSKNKFDTASICTIVSILITGVVIVFTIVALEARATGQQVPANALSPEPTNAIFDTPVTVLVTVPTTSTIIAAKLRARMARSEAELFPAQNGTETNESLDLVLRSEFTTIAHVVFVEFLLRFGRFLVPYYLREAQSRA